VNNAGTSYDHPELFTCVSEETITRILQLNVAGVTGVARQVLPGMMERRRGVIVNIGSAFGALPGPYLAVYAASKMYVDKLSQDLAVEAAPRGVTIQCVQPGPVATKMSKIKYVRRLLFFSHIPTLPPSPLPPRWRGHLQDICCLNVDTARSD
jgi:17beta-estradiol 17-dehydrogenase / very-long-chain 3-oxoacyl-CoA reductase